MRYKSPFPVSLIPLVERDDDEDDLVYKGSIKKKKKRVLAVNDEEITDTCVTALARAPARD
jgi:hypothetical protein